MRHIIDIEHKTKDRRIIEQYEIQTMLEERFDIPLGASRMEWIDQGGSLMVIFDTYTESCENIQDNDEAKI